ICNSGQMLVMFRSNDAALAQGFSASYYNSTGIHEMDDPEITLAPNPAKDHVLIGFSNAKQEIYKIGIYAVEGKQIAENNYELLPGQNSINLDVSMLKTGFYIIRISSDSGIAVKKIIIE
ncbi:MAG TPA: T9SS type A sorting domain-containing protein, partial [Bacteroidales bacterium]|nr:T9SS type A sorting domain-containing protein [Bacteroidales bacterium]